MECKIGEIFEYNGEWYQCVNTGFSCADCDIKGDCSDISIGACSSLLRKDGKQVHLKKLKKVGEPFLFDFNADGNQLWMQQYHFFEKPKLSDSVNFCINSLYDKTILIEIKQKQEDMEENKLNLKPFDLEAAKLGKPVCTRDGRKARIICFDMKGDICPMVAAVEENGVEYLYRYDEKGLNCYKKSNEDLMMLPEKKEGWINIVKTEAGGYCCKGEEVHSDYNDAILENINVLDKRGIIVKIEWEE